MSLGDTFPPSLDLAKILKRHPASSPLVKDVKALMPKDWAHALTEDEQISLREKVAFLMRTSHVLLTVARELAIAMQTMLAACSA